MEIWNKQTKRAVVTIDDPISNCILVSFLNSSNMVQRLRAHVQKCWFGTVPKTFELKGDFPWTHDLWKFRGGWRRSVR